MNIIYCLCHKYYTYSEKYNYETYRKLVNSDKIKLINEIDSKIPLQDLEYYYL
jgi:hypothetical protein